MARNCCGGLPRSLLSHRQRAGDSGRRRRTERHPARLRSRTGTVSMALGAHIPPLCWLDAGRRRAISMGSATVAMAVASGVLAPMVGHLGVRPELLVLATGTGSIILSHVNDPGFWMIQSFFQDGVEGDALDLDGAGDGAVDRGIGDDVAAGGGVAVVEIATVRWDLTARAFSE